MVSYHCPKNPALSSRQKETKAWKEMPLSLFTSLTSLTLKGGHVRSEETESNQTKILYSKMSKKITLVFVHSFHGFSGQQIRKQASGKMLVFFFLFFFSELIFQWLPAKKGDSLHKNSPSGRKKFIKSSLTFMVFSF